MAANTGERTLISAIIPPGSAHIHGITSLGAPHHPATLVAVAGAMSSLLSDFMVRSAPKSAITSTVVNNLLMVPLDHALVPKLVLRTLRLNCVTAAYADLWAECWDEAFLNDTPVLSRCDERPIAAEWSPDTPLRRAADRRNAQVEIDALVALMLDVPITDLCTIYRTQFAVLYGYDQHEYVYDANGRLLRNSALSLWRQGPEGRNKLQAGAAARTTDYPTQSAFDIYAHPFTTFDREENLTSAYLQLS